MMYLTTKNAGGYCGRPPPSSSHMAPPLSAPSYALWVRSPGSDAARPVPRPCPGPSCCPWPLRAPPRPLCPVSSATSLCAEFDRHELLIYEEVARMPPFRRKTLVLIGAQGVGRRSLKNKLIMWDPDRYGTTVPCEWERGLLAGGRKWECTPEARTGARNGQMHGHHVE